MNKRRSRSLLAGAMLFLAATVFNTVSKADSTPGNSLHQWSLNDRCPAGFAPDSENRCRLVSLYREYPSLQDRGMGGLRIGLPVVRDGFTPQQIDLGRYLFFDPLLSGNVLVSCATCHQPEKGFADGLPRSVGAQGTEVHRSSPSLWNAGLQELYFWDGRAETLEQQKQGPLYDEKEMASSPQHLLTVLNENAIYPGLFRQAFPGDKGPVSLDQI